MIYLASPYSHPNCAVREQRFFDTRNFTYTHLMRGNSIFSPIVYCHQFSKTYGAATDAAAWLDHNTRWLERAGAVWVLKLEGWQESVGVRGEIEQAKRAGIPLYYKEPLA